VLHSADYISCIAFFSTKNLVAGSLLLMVNVARKWFAWVFGGEGTSTGSPFRKFQCLQPVKLNARFHVGIGEVNFGLGSAVFGTGAGSLRGRSHTAW